MGLRTDSFRNIVYSIGYEWKEWVDEDNVVADKKVGKYKFYDIGLGYNENVYIGLIVEDRFSEFSDAKAFVENEKKQWASFPDQVKDFSLEEWDNGSITGYAMQVSIGGKFFKDVYFEDTKNRILYRATFMHENDEISAEALSAFEDYINSLAWK